MSTPQADETPLTEAIQRGDIDMTTLLIQLGADVDFPSKDGTTPLMKACATDNPNIVKLLLSEGASATAQNEVRKFRIISGMCRQHLVCR
jgi:ankyrin repeat protein